MSDKPRLSDEISKKIDPDEDFVYEKRWAPLVLHRTYDVHPIHSPIGINIVRRSDYIGKNEPSMYCAFSLEEALTELKRDDVEYISIQDFPVPYDEYDYPEPNKIIIKKGENGKFDVEVKG